MLVLKYPIRSLNCMKRSFTTTSLLLAIASSSVNAFLFLESMPPKRPPPFPPTPAVTLCKEEKRPPRRLPGAPGFELLY